MRIFASTLLCAALSVPTVAQADLFGNSKKAAFRSQTSVLDSRARSQVRASVSLEGRARCHAHEMGIGQGL